MLEIKILMRIVALKKSTFVSPKVILLDIIYKVFLNIEITFVNLCCV